MAPILAANADIITMLEAGFIGAWGEWHGSTNGLENNESRKAVLTRLLSALPAGRMVAVRCNFHKRGALGSDKPLVPEEAFDGSPRSRVGAHNDCLGASQNDFGTYSDNALEAEKTFLSLDNRYVPQEGETCSPGPFAQCAGMLKDLKMMRWDMLNMGYHPDPMPKLHNKPEYSIRLANAGLWEDSTGLNSLRHSVFVSAAAGEAWLSGPLGAWGKGWRGLQRGKAYCSGRFSI